VTSDEGLGRGHRLEQVLAHARPRYLMPTRQPNAHPRERMLVLAERQGTVIVATDHGELAIDRPDTPAPLAAYGAAVTDRSERRSGAEARPVDPARAPAHPETTRGGAREIAGTPVLEQLVVKNSWSSTNDLILETRRAQLQAGWINSPGRFAVAFCSGGCCA
jgi:hypothetical protein